MSEEELIAKFRPYTFYKDNETYIKALFALQFIKECNRNELAIIGIEGFKLINNSLKPQLDMIADFSSSANFMWQEYKKLANEAARKFVQKKLASTKIYQNIVFSFVLNNGNTRLA